MDWKGTVRRLQAVLDAVRRVGGETSELIVDEPALESGVRAAEAELGQPIPPALRDFLLTCAARVDFSWRLPQDFALPGTLRRIEFGSFQLSLSGIIEAEMSRRDLVDYIVSIDADRDILSALREKFAFCLLANRDFLLVDLSTPGLEPVVYFEHEDDQMLGYRMAGDYLDFITRWSSLGSPGPEWWQWEPFIDGKGGPIDPHCANAELWKRALDLKR